jgi:glycosyltransferase involved in cell wall biosynthesis
MHRPLVSIITPTLNQGRFIEETIRSVLEQDYPEIEYIVVDGGSSDGTLGILHKYSSKLRWISEPDRGQSDAINKGWNLASGEVLSWLNSDDLLNPGTVRSIVEIFEQDENVGMVYGDAEKIDRFGKILEIHRAGDNKPFMWSWLGVSIPFNIPQPSAFIKAKLLKEVGCLDINLHYAMDYDLFLRIASVAQIAYLPRPLAKMRIYFGTKSSRNTDQNWREKISVLKRHQKLWFTSQLWRRYLRYRLWSFVPEKYQRKFRSFRNSARDNMYLNEASPNESATNQNETL